MNILLSLGNQSLLSNLWLLLNQMRWSRNIFSFLNNIIRKAVKSNVFHVPARLLSSCITREIVITYQLQIVTFFLLMRKGSINAYCFVLCTFLSHPSEVRVKKTWANQSKILMQTMSCWPCDVLVVKWRKTWIHFYISSLNSTLPNLKPGIC